MKWLLFLVWITTAVAAALHLGISTASSGGPSLLILLLPVWLLILGVTTLLLLSRWKEHENISISLCFFASLVILGASMAAWVLAYRSVHPNIYRYTFGYGNSGSWHEVQIWVKHNNKWVKGPWVGGSPLELSFHDLNHDGRPDIQISTPWRGSVTLMKTTEENAIPVHVAKRDEVFVNYPEENLLFP